MDTVRTTPECRDAGVSPAAFHEHLPLAGLGRISPDHYARFKIEPIDFIEKNNLGFSAGNVVKYVCRYDAKNGIEDLKKAKRYLEFLIAKEEGRDPSSACA